MSNYAWEWKRGKNPEKILITDHLPLLRLSLLYKYEVEYKTAPVYEDIYFCIIITTQWMSQCLYYIYYTFVLNNISFSSDTHVVLAGSSHSIYATHAHMESHTHITHIKWWWWEFAFIRPCVCYCRYISIQIWFLDFMTVSVRGNEQLGRIFFHFSHIVIFILRFTLFGYCYNIFLSIFACYIYIFL